MPYAYVQQINHIFDTDHLKIYVTFRHQMQRSEIPQATPPVYDWYPIPAKWLLEADEVPVDIIASEWLDQFTLLLTSDIVDPEPTGVTLAYEGPDEKLCYNWGKQIEPWGPRESFAGYPTTPAPHKSTHENGGADEISLTGLSGQNIWPQRASMFHAEATLISGGALTAAYLSTQRHTEIASQSSPSDADSFSNSFSVKAGTYTFSVLGLRGPGKGKIDWYIDDIIVIAGQDWYNPVEGINITKTTTGIVITTDGYHKLVGTVNGKNDDSTGYLMALTKYWLKPASDPSRV